jgi:hypothetical protein
MKILGKIFLILLILISIPIVALCGFYILMDILIWLSPNGYQA